MSSLKIDLHIHSKYSHDSFTHIDKIIKFAKKIGLDGIAITDHDTIKGAQEALKHKNDDIKIIVGSEITLNNCGEVLGLFLNEDVQSGSFLEVYDRIKAQDGIVILPHPFRRIKKTIEKIDASELSKIKIIETLNASNFPEENEEALKFAKAKSLISIAGSDAHFYTIIGQAYTVFSNSDKDLREQLRKGLVQIAGHSIDNKHRTREYLNRELKSKHYKKLIDNYLHAIEEKIK